MQNLAVMIYVQHLLGIGHLRRMSFLASALANSGFEVNLVSGGFPVSGLPLDGVAFHQLPSLRSLDGQFDKLVDENDREINAKWKFARRDCLLSLFEKISPRALITETFPFGRRMLRFELLPLLEAARKSKSPPLIVSSIRDILQPKSKPGRNQEVADLIDCYYDKILVHGDEKFTALSDTFPYAKRFTDKTFYTGYITEPDTPCVAGDGKGEVLVSGGGGAASLPLLRLAIDARQYSSLKNATWRLLVGHNISSADFEQLCKHAGGGVVVERNRSDFSTLLKNCAVSVSQAGYNTVMDVLKTKTRAVLVPYAMSGEKEQILRTQQLEKVGAVVGLFPENLTAESLAQAIDTAAKKKPPSVDVDMNGDLKSAALLRAWLDG